MEAGMQAELILRGAACTRPPALQMCNPARSRKLRVNPAAAGGVDSRKWAPKSG